MFQSGGMFGPSPEDIWAQQENEALVRKRTASSPLVGNIGNLFDSAFMQGAKAFGGGDPRERKAQLVQEAVIAAREATQGSTNPADMYAALAKAFNDRGLGEEAVKASTMARQLGREDKADLRADKADARADSAESRALRQQDNADKAAIRDQDVYEWTRSQRQFTEQLTQMSIQEKAQALKKLLAEEQLLNERIASGFYKDQDKLTLDKLRQEIQTARIQAETSLQQARNSGAALANDNARLKLEQEKVNELKARFEREGFETKVQTDPYSGKVTAFITNRNVPQGQQPKMYIWTADEGMREVKPGETPTPINVPTNPFITDIDKELAKRQGK